MRTREARQRFESAAAFLALVFFLPAALATPTAGSLDVASLSLPPQATSSTRFLALVHNDGANLTRGTLNSEAITFCEYERPYAEVAIPDPILQFPTTVDVQESCFPLTNVVMMISPDAGWIGLRSRQTATAELSHAVRAEVQPEKLSTLASIRGRIAGTDDTRNPWFHETIQGPHLLYSTAGLVLLQGEGEIRFMGPDVEVRAAENNTVYETGEEIQGGTPHARERVMRWVVVKFDAATVTLETSTPLIAAAREAHSLAWDGNVTATGVRGYLSTQDVTYEPGREGSAAYLDGVFIGSFAPNRDGESAKLRVEGILRQTSLMALGVPLPAQPVTLWTPWLLLLGTVVLVAAGGAAAGTSAVLRRRYRRRVESLEYPYKVEDCKEAAVFYMQAEDYARALPWLERARSQAPRSAALAEHEAFCHAMLGDVDEALSCYAEADALSPSDGDAAMGAARLLRGREPIEEVYRWLRIALEKSPQFVVELEEEFPELLNNPEWKPIIERARDRLEADWTDRHG